MVQNLCTHFSPVLLNHPSDSVTLMTPYHPFPSPQALSDPSVEATLRGLGFGYRAKYIQKTAALLCENHSDPQKWLLGLRNVPTAEAREELLQLAGVGPKVADCILLMSLDKVAKLFLPSRCNVSSFLIIRDHIQHEVVPIDTHMLQIAIKHYNFRVPGYSSSSNGKSAPPMTPKLHQEVSAKLQKIWGPYAGWAHSVLFTSDLKAFALPAAADGGLPPPNSPITADLSKGTAVKEEGIATPSTNSMIQAAQLDSASLPKPRRKRKSEEAKLSAGTQMLSTPPSMRRTRSATLK